MSNSYEKGFHISWDQVHRDSKALAWRLDHQGPGKEGGWRAIIAITRGGLVPAAIVARELNIRVIDTICVKSYAHKDQTEATVLKGPDSALIGDGEGVLVIDDLRTPAARWRWCAASIPAPISPPSMQSPRAARWWTPSSPRSARTPGSISPGTWRCSMWSRCAAPEDLGASRAQFSAC